MQTIRAVCDASCSSHHSGGECSILVAVQDWAYVGLEVHIGIHDSILTRLLCGIEYFTRLGGSPNLDSPQIDSLNLELTMSSQHKLIDLTSGLIMTPPTDSLAVDNRFFSPRHQGYQQKGTLNRFQAATTCVLQVLLQWMKQVNYSARCTWLIDWSSL